MLESAIDDEAYDLHVMMRVHAKALPRGDDVFIDDSKAAPVDVLRVAVLIKWECEPAF